MAGRWYGSIFGMSNHVGNFPSFDEIRSSNKQPITSVEREEKGKADALRAKPDAEKESKEAERRKLASEYQATLSQVKSLPAPNHEYLIMNTPPVVSDISALMKEAVTTFFQCDNLRVEQKYAYIRNFSSLRNPEIRLEQSFLILDLYVSYQYRYSAPVKTNFWGRVIESPPIDSTEHDHHALYLLVSFHPSIVEGCPYGSKLPKPLHASLGARNGRHLHSYTAKCDNLDRLICMAPLPTIADAYGLTPHVISQYAMKDPVDRLSNVAEKMHGASQIRKDLLSNLGVCIERLLKCSSSYDDERSARQDKHHYHKSESDQWSISNSPYKQLYTGSLAYKKKVEEATTECQRFDHKVKETIRPCSLYEAISQSEVEQILIYDEKSLILRSEASRKWSNDSIISTSDGGGCLPI